MKNHESFLHIIKQDLVNVSSCAKAEASRRYFPNGIHCIGANANDIKMIIAKFHSDFAYLSANEVLSISEYILNKAEYSEEVLIAFALINKFVKKHYDETLLDRFEYWLENYASNWSHVDDLCIKTIYQYLIARPELIVKTQHWAFSKVPWCRRASNVVWVKFIKRNIAKSTYFLDKTLIFKHCDLLITDNDEFVQKSVGWLLKVTSVHYQNDVVTYILTNATKMHRSTIRYAVEKMDKDTRKTLLVTTK